MAKNSLPCRTCPKCGVSDPSLLVQKDKDIRSNTILLFVYGFCIGAFISLFPSVLLLKLSTTGVISVAFIAGGLGAGVGGVMVEKVSERICNQFHHQYKKELVENGFSNSLAQSLDWSEGRYDC